MTGVGPDLGAMASGWQAAPGPLALLTVLAVAYAGGVARVQADARTGRRGRRWPLARSVAFAGGLLTLAVALLSGLDARGHEQLSTHMVQHLLITMVAAPLIVAGAPLSLALQATRGAVRRRLGAATRSRTVRVLTAAPVAFVLFGAAMFATHVPALYDAALRSPELHAVEHLVYLGTAVLFWVPLIGANPVPQLRGWAGRTIYLLLAMPLMSIVGVVLVSSTTVRYATYADAAPSAASALLDQEAGGAIMWVGGTVAMAVALLVLGFQAMLAEERRQQARDALAAGEGAGT